MFSNIPEELRQYPQWVVWKLEADDNGKPTKRPYNPHTGTLASPTNGETWSSFDHVLNIVSNTDYYDGIGFVLSENDPYAFIDLDDPFKIENGMPKHKDAEAQFELQKQIFERFNTYAELSPSGKGLHIICKGSIPQGKRKGSIELYSAERYMTMTGNVYRAVPIVDCHETLNSLFEYLGGNEAQAASVGTYSAPQTLTDEEVIARACEASNAAKFIDLLEANWQGMYQSQSEADFAFIDIVAFYTDNKEQVKRIFENSKLGERNKQTTIRGVPYIDYMVNRSFDRKLPPVDHSALTAQIESAIAAKASEEKRGRGRPKKFQGDTNPYSVPPGLVGRIANFIYASAPRPVPEIALVGAIGLVAGMAGRAYNISGTGLNQYVLLLAKTGTGKEAIGAGISTLLSEVKKIAPTAPDFIGPTVIASPQALIKKLAKNKSFVSIIGEFGLKLQQMTGRNATAADRGILTALLDLFNKSGCGSVMGSMAYSDSDKDISAVDSPALSIIGESTPESFFEGIDERSIKSGLVPRFTVIEYKGDRPDLNENRLHPSQCPALVDELAKFAANCAMLNHQNKVTQVQLDDGAHRLFRDYNLYVDGRIRGSHDASREIWNRAHIKALKMAALIAVGCNWMCPTITEEMAHWAINIENQNVFQLLNRFEEGEVGANMEVSELAQMREVRRIVREWISRPWDEVNKYAAGTEEMHRLKVIPAKYLNKRLANKAAFKEDRRGASVALQRILTTMCEHGDLQAVKNKVLYGSTALCYVVTNVAEFL